MKIGNTGKAILGCTILYLILTSGLGYCLDSDPWEFFDQGPAKPKTICIDSTGQKWFTASDGVWVLDGAVWKKFTRSTTGINATMVIASSVSPAGVLWFGTMYEGAFSYDGVSWRNYDDMDGLGNNWVNGIAFDRDGGTWFATPGQVACLRDGKWQRYDTQSMHPYSGLTGVAVDRKGNVWLSTSLEGALRYDGVSWRHFTDRNSGIGSNYVNDILVAPDGRVIFGTDRGISILDGVSWQWIPENHADKVCLDHRGNIWSFQASSLSCYDGRHVTGLGVARSPSSDKSNTITGLEVDADDRVWIATAQGVFSFSGRFLQITPLSDRPGTLPVFTTGSSLNIEWSSNRVENVSLEYSADGANWNPIASPVSAPTGECAWTIPLSIPASGYMAARLSIRVSAVEDTSLTDTLEIQVEVPGLRESWTKYSPSTSGIASYYVRNIVETGDGVKWFATDRGVSRFDGVNWKTFTQENSGLAANDVTGCAADAEGGLWFGTTAGISRYDGAQWKTWFEGKPVLRIGAGRNALWMVCADSLSYKYNYPVNPVLYRRDGESWVSYRTAEGDTINPLNDFAVDPAGNVWISRFVKGNDLPNTSWTRQQLLRCNGDRWQVYTPDNILSEARIVSFTWDQSDRFWGVVQSRGDLVSFDGNEWKRYTRENSGRPDAGITSLAFDSRGVLWCAAPYTGIYSFDGVQWKAYDTLHGWPVNRMGNMLRLFIDQSGAKWLITDDSGLCRFDELMVPVEEAQTVPPEFRILGNYPNPFNPSTTVRFRTSSPGKTSLAIYSITGQKVRELFSDHSPAGEHSVVWNGADDRGQPAASGIYFARLTAGRHVSTMKMLLMK